jgi:SnoaL-like domain
MTCSDAMLARLRFADVMTMFATSADRGEAIKALRFCADDIVIGAEGDDKPRGALANLLMMRQVMDHRTRHHVASPVIHDFSGDYVRGTCTVVSYKVAGAASSFAVTDFEATLRKGVDEVWRISRLRMIPFASFEQDDL